MSTNVLYSTYRWACAASNIDKRVWPKEKPMAPVTLSGWRQNLNLRLLSNEID